MVSTEEAPGVLMAGFAVALLVAMGVVAAALVWIGARWVSTRLERRYLGNVGRWSRRRAGVAEEAGPWACATCRSVNAPTKDVCYRCGARRIDEARELAPSATDPVVYHRPPPVSQFDPSRYRGPGAPAKAEGNGDEEVSGP